MSDKTAMAEAFSLAGFEAPPDRLCRMMREAIIKGSGIQPNVLALFERMLAGANSAALERALVGEEARHWAAVQLFQSIRSEERKKQESDKIRDVTSRNQDGGRGPPGSAVGSAVVGHSNPVAATSPPTTSPPPATSPRHAAVAEIAALSLLRRFRINGKPIGDVTAGEARTWLRHHERDGRWVRLMLDGLSDSMRIGDYVKDNDADRLYRLATEADNE